MTRNGRGPGFDRVYLDEVYTVTGQTHAHVFRQIHDDALRRLIDGMTIPPPMLEPDTYEPWRVDNTGRQVVDGCLREAAPNPLIRRDRSSAPRR